MQIKVERNGIDVEAERARRYEAHLSVLLVNVDGLAGVTETWGKDVGDTLLEQVAELIRQNIRKIDVFGRWDREDFVVLTVDRNVDGSLILAEKLRQKISEHVFEWDGQPRHSSVSIGLARGVPADEGQIDRLIESAREAVRRAQANGCDRVECQV